MKVTANVVPSEKQVVAKEVSSYLAPVLLKSTSSDVRVVKLSQKVIFSIYPSGVVGSWAGMDDYTGLYIPITGTVTLTFTE